MTRTPRKAKTPTPRTGARQRVSDDLKEAVSALMPKLRTYSRKRQEMLLTVAILVEYEGERRPEAIVDLLGRLYRVQEGG
jgi:hypothetical protein